MSGTSGGEGQVPASEGPGPGQRPEHEAAHEVAEPRGRPPQARRHRFSWRTPVAVLLIIAGGVSRRPSQWWPCGRRTRFPTPAAMSPT